MSSDQNPDEIAYLEALLSGDPVAVDNHDIDVDSAQAFQLMQRIQTMFSGSDSTENRFQPGDQWGTLTIEEPLGSGGVGVVYQAFDHVLNRRVAVKFLHTGSERMISSLAFINEARRLAKVRHHRVMAIFGAQTHEGVTGFWAEQLSGTPLNEIDLNALGRSDQIKLMHQLSTAVSAIHQLQLIHADIKPQNVMIEPGRGPVLMDFGAGRDLSERADSMIPGLTPMAMAPELFRGESISLASDVYALGLVFYFILSGGQHPHATNDFAALKSAVSDPKQAPISQGLKAPRSLRQLINRMCAYDPQIRPSMQEVEADLKSAIEAPKKRLKRVALGSFIGFLLGSLAVLAYSYVAVNQERDITQQALQETQSINNLIADFMFNVSPTRYGKDVLLIDMLSQLSEGVASSQDISTDNQAVLLSNLAMAEFYVGYPEQGLALLESTQQMTDLSPLMQANLVLVHTRLIDERLDLGADDQKSQISQGIKQAKHIIDNHQLDDEELTARLNYLLARLAKRNLELTEAEQFYQKALDYWQSLPSSKNVELEQFNILTSLGNVAADSQQMDLAESYYQQALQKAQQHTSIKHNSNLNVAFNNMTVHLAQTGDINQAITAFTELLDKNKVFYGESHNKTLLVVNNLVSAHNQAKQFAEAKTLINEYEGYFADQKQQDSMLSLYHLSTKAIALAGLEDYDQAGEIYESIIQIAKQTWGTEHPMTLINQVNLAENYNHAKQPQKAMDLLSEPWQIVQNAFNDDHEIAVYYRLTMARSFQALGDLQQAQSLMQSVYDSRMNTLGAEHPDTQEALSLLNQINSELRG